MRRLLNVGGSSKEISLPPEYAGWEHVLLDIDPQCGPDIVCDARKLSSLPAATYDCVYCSHNLEHYYRHDALVVLAGFAHVLKPDGFAHISVPDMGALMKMVVEMNLDIDDFISDSPKGPIAVRDVIYGWGAEIESSGNDFYAHKNGFTQKSLMSLLQRAGFPWIFSTARDLEITALAFRNQPSEYAQKLFNLPAQAR